MYLGLVKYISSVTWWPFNEPCVREIHMKCTMIILLCIIYSWNTPADTWRKKTSLLRQNYVATSFRCHIDVIFTLYVRWDISSIPWWSYNVSCIREILHMKRTMLSLAYILHWIHIKCTMMILSCILHSWTTYQGCHDDLIMYLAFVKYIWNVPWWSYYVSFIREIQIKGKLFSVTQDLMRVTLCCTV